MLRARTIKAPCIEDGDAWEKRRSEVSVDVAQYLQIACQGDVLLALDVATSVFSVLLAGVARNDEPSYRVKFVCEITKCAQDKALELLNKK